MKKLNKFKTIAASLAVTSVMATSSALAGVELMSDKPFWGDQLDAVMNAAGKKHGKKMTHTAYPNPEQYKGFIQSSAVSGDMPELFTWWSGAAFKELVATGQIAHLDELWEEMTANGEYNKSLRDFYVVDGKAYGVPLHFSRWIVFYNKNIFAKHGLKEPKNWMEFESIIKKLKSKGQTPFVATTQDGWRGFIWFQELMIRTNLEAYKGLHTGKVAYNSDAVRNAFKIWVDWYKKGYFTDPRSKDAVSDFVKGKGAMWLLGDWTTGAIETAGLKADKDFSAFIMPNKTAGLPSSAILEAGPIVMSKKGAKNPDVIKALKFFTSVEGGKIWAKESGNSNGNNKIAANTISAKISADVAANKTIAVDRWWEVVPPELQGEFVAEFNRFMLNPTMNTAEDVMKKLQFLNAEYWDNQ